MSTRLSIYRLLVLALLFAGHLTAQSVAAWKDRLQQATGQSEQYELACQLAQALLPTEPIEAERYARQALDLAIVLQDQNREINAARLGAEAAAQAGHLPGAIQWYGRMEAAASAAAQPEQMLQALDKLQILAAQQGDYQAAYAWSQQRTALLQEKARRAAEVQRQQQESVALIWQAESTQRDRWFWGLLSGLAVVLFLFYYTRQRSNRRMRGELAEKNAMIEEKRRRSEQLLLNILPQAVAAELTVRNKVAARRYERATIMFIDFVGFTRIAEQLPPEELLAELDYCFSRFDELIGRNRIEKIKTVGDAYICASGLTDRNERPTAMIEAALQIQDFLGQLQEKRRAAGQLYFEARIGIHFGPVIAGVVGTKKFAYDIWGDTVNTAARLEAACAPGHVNVSDAVRAVVEAGFQWEYRGKIAVKNKDELDMYYVTP